MPPYNPYIVYPPPSNPGAPNPPTPEVWERALRFAERMQKKEEKKKLKEDEEKKKKDKEKDKPKTFTFLEIFGLLLFASPFVAPIHLYLIKHSMEWLQVLAK